MSTQTFTTCPACGRIADIRDRFVLSSTDGPIEHLKMTCLLGHHFVLPTADLDRTSTAGSRDHAGYERSLVDASEMGFGRSANTPYHT